MSTALRLLRARARNLYVDEIQKKKRESGAKRERQREVMADKEEGEGEGEGEITGAHEVEAGKAQLIKARHWREWMFCCGICG